MSTQPCPCGFHNDPTRECKCSPIQVQRYVSKISGPLMDRIDIHIDVPAVKFKELASDTPAESSAVIRERVVRARRVQLERFASERIFHGALPKIEPIVINWLTPLHHGRKDLGDHTGHRGLTRKRCFPSGVTVSSEVSHPGSRRISWFPNQVNNLRRRRIPEIPTQTN